MTASHNYLFAAVFTAELLAPAVLANDKPTQADIESFITGKKEFPSPAWKTFKAITGDTKESRELFAEIMEDERRAGLIERAEANPANACEVYVAELKRIDDAAQKAMAPFMGQPLSDGFNRTVRSALLEAVPPMDVVACLFLGTYPRNALNKPKARALFRTSFASALEGPSGKEVRKLFAAWVDRRREAASDESAIAASLTFGLPEGVPAARRLIANKMIVPRLVGQSLLVLGHHGSKEDLPVVISFRNDERQAVRAFRPNGEILKGQQVRDFAAAMALKLLGQDFEKFGFESDTFLDWQVRDGESPYRSVSMFKSDADRAAALKKAWDWIDKQPKK